jgi:FkbM family methyltransferase
MLVAFPISLVDQDLALKNAQWINELGGCKGHEALFGYDKRCTPGTVDDIRGELIKAFDKVYPFPFEAEIDGWPEGANYFFRVVTAKLETKPNTPCFLWLEPDAIPLKAGWLDMLAEEYKRGNKPFMGDRVQVRDIPLHMSGVGIYPLPLHAFAGEAYRAAEVAWDMAGKDQIVPKAYFTRLIEHAWKHPQFTMLSEIDTQIRPEAVLFHSSKDGSLIDLLRKKAAPETNHHSVPAEPTSVPKTSREEIGTRAAHPSPVYDIFIRTYPGDYDWLRYCIRSIEKYVTGFRKIWMISPSRPPEWFSAAGVSAAPIHIANMEWKQMNDESPDGYLAQQITKLYADVITDYQPDFILHIDSDVILNRPVTPGDFISNDKVVWPYTPYDRIETPWQPITEKFMGASVQYEFMRRLPIMVPRWLYSKLREFAHKRHGMPISQYIINQTQRSFSEFNALGAYAYAYHRDSFDWVNTLAPSLGYNETFARQFHSWSGITPEIKSEIETILRGTESTEASNLAESACPNPPESASVPSQIKVLADGTWVLHGDQISQWVEQEGRLDHDQNFLPKILPLIKPGDTVVDVGAFIGDHTIAYARAVGGHGRVFAFEPNPIAYKCLKHNMALLDGDDLLSVGFLNVALGDRTDSVPLSGNNGNWGGAYIGDHMKITDVPVRPLDEFNLAPDFIKIDAEGYEMKVLSGAQKTILKYHPTLVIEINEEALRRQGEHRNNIFQWLGNHGYRWDVMQENCSLYSPLYDILCSCNKSPEVNGEADLTRCTSSPPPVTSPLTTYGEMIAAVILLKNFAEIDTNHRQRVMQNLSKSGLTPRWPRRKKKKQ